MQSPALGMQPSYKQHVYTCARAWKSLCVLFYLHGRCVICDGGELDVLHLDVRREGGALHSCGSISWCHRDELSPTQHLGQIREDNRTVYHNWRFQSIPKMITSQSICSRFHIIVSYLRMRLISFIQLSLKSNNQAGSAVTHNTRPWKIKTTRRKPNLCPIYLVWQAVSHKHTKTLCGKERVMWRYRSDVNKHGSPAVLAASHPIRFLHWGWRGTSWSIQWHYNWHRMESETSQGDPNHPGHISTLWFWWTDYREAC